MPATGFFVEDPIMADHVSMLKHGVELVISSGRSLRVSGLCMEPLIPDGASVKITKCSTGDISPGDIILVSSGDKFILHRFLRLFNHNGSVMLLTKADRRRRPDCPRPANSLVGKVTAIEINGKETPCKTGILRRLASRLYGMLGLAVLKNTRRICL